MNTTAPQLVTDAPLAHVLWPAAPGAGVAPQAVPTSIVLLHGVGGGRTAWMSSAPLLAAAGHRVLGVDLPGYGLSPMHRPGEAGHGPLSLAQMAHRVQQLLELQAPGPRVLLGHSMGGMVVQEWAASGFTGASALVLVGTSSAFGKPEGAWQQGFLRSRFAPLDAGAGMVGLAQRLVPTLLGSGASPEAQANAMAMMAGVPEATYRAAVQALVGFDRRSALAHITPPTLVITGEQDATAPPDVAQRMAQRLPRGRCRVVPGAGHLLPVEQPGVFADAVLAFLAEELRP